MRRPSIGEIAVGFSFANNVGLYGQFIYLEDSTRFSGDVDITKTPPVDIYSVNDMLFLGYCFLPPSHTERYSNNPVTNLSN